MNRTLYPFWMDLRFRCLNYIAVFKMITFGKHKGKTYEYMIENEKPYCMFVLNQTSGSSKGFREFQTFLKTNIELLNDIHELKSMNSINCSALVQYMTADSNVIDIIKNIITNVTYKPKINMNDDIDSRSFGQFINYLITYEVTKINNEQFKDTCAECILRDGKLNKIQYVKDSYLKMQNNTDVSNVDILNVSICTTICYTRDEDVTKYINYNKQDIISKESYENILQYIKEKVNNKKNIFVRPSMGNASLGIRAGADLIIDNELIKIITSTYDFLSINCFIYLITGAALYYIKTNNV